MDLWGRLRESQAAFVEVLAFVRLRPRTVREEISDRVCPSVHFPGSTTDGRRKTPINPFPAFMIPLPKCRIDSAQFAPCSLLIAFSSCSSSQSQPSAAQTPSSSRGKAAIPWSRVAAAHAWSSMGWTSGLYGDPPRRFQVIGIIQDIRPGGIFPWRG